MNVEIVFKIKVNTLPASYAYMRHLPTAMVWIELIQWKKSLSIIIWVSSGSIWYITLYKSV